MYYIVKIKEYRGMKPDITVIETTDTFEKAQALRDAYRAINPNERYEVMIVYISALPA